MSIRDTGMPVHWLTTSAISSASTSFLSSRLVSFGLLSSCASASASRFFSSSTSFQTANRSSNCLAVGIWPEPSSRLNSFSIRS